MKNYEDLHNHSASFIIYYTRHPRLSWRMTGKKQCHVVSQGGKEPFILKTIMASYG